MAKTALYPSEELYPSESLYPSDGPLHGPKRRKPSLALSVEVEGPNGVFYPLSATSDKARNRPRGLSFSTQRGDGFSGGGFTLSREIFRDYPDLQLLNTVRFVGDNGEIAYEGRIHSNPRTNDPAEQIDVATVGWATYLKSRQIAPLIIDRRLEGWSAPSTKRLAALSLSSYSPGSSSMTAGWQDGGTATADRPGVIFTFDQFSAVANEVGEAWFYAGGEDIGELWWSFAKLASGGFGATKDWHSIGYLSSDDLFTSADTGTDSENTTATGLTLEASTTGRKYAAFASSYGGVFTGTAPAIHAFLGPVVIGNHGLTVRGSTEPERGYYLTDIAEYIVQTYYPKLEWVGETNPFVVTQAAWHDNASNGYEIFQQLNQLVLWELGVWEERKVHFAPTDLTTHDWQIRTDEPGVTAGFQGDSIENFANGVSVTYTDVLTGRQNTLYPSDHEELRDESESNPANRQGENLWTSASVPWSSTEGEALQYGRAYLAEYNRPKRPGTFTVTGHIQDRAGNWHPGWAVRTGDTISILDHPGETEPRLIYATSWDDEGKQLTITVDGPEETLPAIVARHELAFQARNL